MGSRGKAFTIWTAVISAIALAGMATGTSNLVMPRAFAAVTRDATLWPFTSTSPWNMPIGSGAQWRDDPNIRSGDNINAGNGWSHPIFRATTTSPMATVFAQSSTRYGTTNVQYRIPTDATPSSGGDHHMHVIDENGRYVYETWEMSGAGTSWTAGRLERNDLFGAGILEAGARASGVSAIGGLLRTQEVANNSFPHALAGALWLDQITSGPVWPANEQDGAGGYSGTIPMGTLLAIPGNINLNTMGLSSGGLALAHAMQDYGVYVTDTSGAGFTLYAEPDAENYATLNQMRNDLAALRDQLRIVTNNTPTTVGGGGTPRVALAPPLATEPTPTTTTTPPATTTTTTAPPSTSTPQGGYFLATADGSRVSDTAAAGTSDELGTLLQSVVGAAATDSGAGSWAVAGDGGVFAFGDASYFGSMGGVALSRPVVGMAGTPGDRGYWLVASDGGIFSFGDANFYGSTGDMRLNQPIVGMASTPTGRGYWLVASDGGIFAFGDARFFGSTGDVHLNRPIVGVAATPSGNGYWLVASDGGVFSFGDATFHGSDAAGPSSAPAIGIAAGVIGYRIGYADGKVSTFGPTGAFSNVQSDLGARRVVAIVSN